MQDDRLQCLKEQTAEDILEVVNSLNKLSQKVTFLGDGVPVHKSVLEEKLTVPYHIAPTHLNRQSAAAVAALGAVYLEEGKIETAAAHKPVYLRQSQAERERAIRLQQGSRDS